MSSLDSVHSTLSFSCLIPTCTCMQDHKFVHSFADMASKFSFTKSSAAASYVATCSKHYMTADWGGGRGAKAQAFDF